MIYFEPILMVGLVYYSINLIFFGIPLLYYYTNLKSSIIFCLSSKDICLSLGISLLCLFVTVSELFFCEVFEIFVVLSGILLPVKPQCVSAVF